MILNTALFHFDILTWIMISLMGFVAICVASFSYRYLAGDTHQHRFYVRLAALCLGVFIMVSANHLIVLWMSFGLSNYLLCHLMRHKMGWRAAQASFDLALKNFCIGLLFIAIGFFFLYLHAKSLYLDVILSQNIQGPYIFPASLCILIGAMTQSAIWPFHHWLISSLNSPTPVSAIMHAGLINGGGFLLAKFASLYLSLPFMLDIIFVAGMITAVLGTIWMLIQSDIKRMLACSTMGQMGFMIVQCGLGLFPAAVAHLCWHGLLKAYLFLASGSVRRENRFHKKVTIPSLSHFLLALFCGLSGAYLFSLITHKDILALDTNLFLVILSSIAGTQFAITLLTNRNIKQIILTFMATLFMGIIYGSSILVIETLMVDLGVKQPQPLNLYHIIGLLILILGWISFSFRHTLLKMDAYPKWLLGFYVKMLNHSQPHRDTITTHRQHYQF